LLRQQLAESQAINDQLTRELDALKLAHETLMNDTTTTTANSDEQLQELMQLRDALQKNQKEIQRLRQHLLDAEEASTQELLKQESIMEEYKRQLEQLNSERSEWESLLEQEKEQCRYFKESLDENEHIMESMAQEKEYLKQQIQTCQVSIKNLERVLSDFEKGNVQLDFDKI
jgi:chromosome segregation ATPase